MMIMQQPQHLMSHWPCSAANAPRSPSLPLRVSGSSPTRRVRAHFRRRLEPWLLAQVSDPQQQQQQQQQDGPVELPPSLSSSPLFADPNNASPLQVSASVLLTGAISVFLFRSLRRRAKRAKELRLRSSGVKKKGLKEEALDSLKAMQSASVEPRAPPSPAQALLGGLSAGVIALVLYKFTTTIEGALNRQAISDNFSVRQITITIRTIINGLCHLATFVFGINAVGLVLYSGQLAINSLTETSSNNESGEEVKRQNDFTPSTVDLADNLKSKRNDEQKNTNDPQ